MAPSSRSGTQENANQDATRTACETVFGTAELIEQIIAHLPAKQLFVDQRVCKTFASAIAASPTMQVKMFKRLPDSSRMQALKSADSSVTGKHPARSKAPGAAELATKPQLRPILSPWLDFVLKVPQCVRYYPPREKKVESKWRRGARGRSFTTKEDSYLDTYFCDPPCRTITVQQYYLVDGDGFDNTQDVHTDRPMTVREVLEKALDQTGPIIDSVSYKQVVACETMRSIIKSHEQEKGCTDGSKTILSRAEFVLHGVFNPVILEDETTGPDEVRSNYLLAKRGFALSRARADTAT